MAPLDAEVALSDKYRVSRGAALMNGMQALVRLLIEQADADKEAGLNTGGYVSGYRGSPIGGFDMELFRNKAELAPRNVVFNPGLNEDLAATAVGGTQTLTQVDDPSVEGIFALWYGKGPGVDRSMDAIRHVSLAGCTEKGGVVFLLGDDPLCKSSTTAHQSEQAMIHASIPVVFPASVHEYVPIGMHAIAMSRFSGAPVAFKIVTDTADSAATVLLDRLRPEITLPEKPAFEVSLNFVPGLVPYLVQERRLAARLEACKAYARANRLNTTVFEPPAGAPKRLGLVAVGKGFADARTALRLLGLTDEQAAAKGIGLYRMQMVWPVEEKTLLAFAEGYDELLILEEKRPIVETEVGRLLVNRPAPRPVLTGKTDEHGAPLVQDWGELTPEHVAEVIARRAVARSIDGLAAPAPEAPLGNAPSMARSPWFCAGCPHNRSTKLPEGSTAGAGIGCHAMAIYFDPNTQYFAQMGAEGMHWVGRAPFAGRKHMFQNLGDGTYTHSGLLAIKAAVAAGTNITYKILYNDAVAMTGGQAMEGAPLPADIAAQVLSVGVTRVVVVSDDPDATKETGVWPTDKITFHDRAEHILVQTQLREEAGTSVLLYVQTCAAEKRRRRKRNKFPDPPKRVVINPAVCEGCGDCGLKSNCVAVKPLDTPFGTKRQIDQTACNKDYSCIEGFCPSFVTVEGEASDPLAGKAKGILHAPPEGLPPAALAPAEDFAAVVTGIGGTGVVTVAAVLAMAARLEGLSALTLDQTGLSQKNGAVQSHLQIGPRALDDRPARVARGTGRLLLACDMLTAAQDDALGRISPVTGIAVANGRVEPLPAFAINPNARADGEQLAARLESRLGKDKVLVRDVAELSAQLVGDGMGQNMMLVGVASQAGALPMTPEAIEKAIRLNGAAVEMNLAAFRWGRWLAADPAKAEARVSTPQLPSWKAESYDDLVARFTRNLTAYQSSRYAARFRAALAKVEAAEDRHWPGRRELSRLAARALHKTFHVKDEYEVARLHRSPEWKALLKRDFAPDVKITHHLAPPMISKLDPVTGHPRKQPYAAKVMGPAFAVLANLKMLRGTPLDVFGRTEERRTERALIGEVEALTAAVAAHLTPATEATAREILELPLEVKGYGHVKQANLDRVRPRWRELIANLSKAPENRAAAA